MQGQVLCFGSGNHGKLQARNPCHLFSIEMRAGQVLRRIWSDQAQCHSTDTASAALIAGRAKGNISSHDPGSDMATVIDDAGSVDR